MSLWSIFRREGVSGFSAASTAEEVTEGIDGTGLTAIVTGASSGIGYETARVLAHRNVHVVMGLRNMATAKGVKESIAKHNPAAKIDVMELDLSSISSVRKFASSFSSSGLPLNILINNAGIMMTPFTLSEDNIESQFATNHLGHFLLTNLLLETMKSTAQRTQKEGRIVNVSSRRHKFSYPEGIRFDRINDRSGYNSLSSYAQSKLANVLHSNDLARRLKAEGIDVTVNSVHPGPIATNIFRHSRLISAIIHTFGKYFLKNVQQGAATTCYVALHPRVGAITGKYFSDCNISEPSSQAKDAEMAKKLWDLSSDLVHRSPTP
ncbi:hypothetical protein SAY86_023011 [Trapa natans]|uniref:Short-chain dehydrogenase TIC 32, chloroplastic-like n=1 Tax=Trapa natans TaxID=22666 RepID=A0AAN7M9P9_TRANT|nr:hypothetical protein SAY86_023011 [Trapa natans]